MIEGTSGFYNGKHYTEYVEEVKSLKRNNKLDEAEQLLLCLVNACENEYKITGLCVPPWYYEQLAIVYKKKCEKQNEINILERYKTIVYEVINKYNIKDKNRINTNFPLLLRLEKAKYKNE